MSLSVSWLYAITNVIVATTTFVILIPRPSTPDSTAPPSVGEADEVETTQQQQPPMGTNRRKKLRRQADTRAANTTPSHTSEHTPSIAVSDLCLPHTRKTFPLQSRSYK